MLPLLPNKAVIMLRSDNRQVISFVSAKINWQSQSGVGVRIGVGVELVLKFPAWSGVGVGVVSKFVHSKSLGINEPTNILYF